jgi:hypothetical protein
MYRDEQLTLVRGSWPARHSKESSDLFYSLSQSRAAEQEKILLPLSMF